MIKDLKNPPKGELPWQPLVEEAAYMVAWKLFSAVSQRVNEKGAVNQMLLWCFGNVLQLATLNVIQITLNGDQ